MVIVEGCCTIARSSSLGANCSLVDTKVKEFWLVRYNGLVWWIISVPFFYHPIYMIIDTNTIKTGVAFKAFLEIFLIQLPAKELIWRQDARFFILCFPMFVLKEPITMLKKKYWWKFLDTPDKAMHKPEQKCLSSQPSFPRFVSQNIRYCSKLYFNFHIRKSNPYYKTLNIEKSFIMFCTGNGTIF